MLLRPRSFLSSVNKFCRFARESNSRTKMSHFVDFKPEELHILREPNDENIYVTYFKAGELRTMVRPKADLMSKTLQRLAKSMENVSHSQEKRNKKQQQKEHALGGGHVDATTRNCVEFEGAHLDATSLSNDEFQNGMRVSLCTTGHSFVVLVNPPIVTSITAFPRKQMTVNYSIVPRAMCKNCDGVEIAWFGGKIESSSCASHPQKTAGSVSYNWLSSDYVFVPSDAHVGFSLKVYCTPYKRGTADSKVYGRPAVAFLPGTIEADNLSELCRARLAYRDDYCSKFTSVTENATNLDIFRVLSYNVLADTYASRQSAIKYTYPYCKQEYLDFEFRSQRNLTEIARYCADVIGLQECEQKLFENYLQPYYESKQYFCSYSNKSGSVVEGCAMFVNSKKLRVLQLIDVPIKHSLRSSAYMRKHVYSIRPDLVDILGGKISSIVQIAVCQKIATNSNPINSSNREEVVLIANTHLFYHPVADFVRLHQTHAVLQILQAIKSQIEADAVSKPVHIPGGTTTIYSSLRVSDEATLNLRVSCILLGDLNSSPDTASIDLIINGSAVANTELELTINELTWKGDSEEEQSSSEVADSINFGALSICSSAEIDENSLKGFEHVDHIDARLTSQIIFVSACGFPQFTNYVAAFKNCLDYIFIDRSAFEVLEAAPMPTESVLNEFVALPSIVFPSDHISIVADIRLTS